MSKSSVRGKIASELIEDIVGTPVGQALPTGKIYKRLKEPKWICPLGYSNKRIAIGDCHVEMLLPRKNRRDVVVLQLHGGGYIGALRNAHRRLAVQYSKRTNNGCVVTLDYRVAPEHPFPAAVEDALLAYHWIIRVRKIPSNRVIVVGDSAGGGLALALGQYLKDHDMPMPAGFICMSPWSDLSLSGKTLETNMGKDPLFGHSKDNMIYNKSYPGEHNLRDPYLSPLFGDYKGFPPMLFQVGGNEVLLDDTLRVARKARKQGVKTRLHVYPEMFHVFQMALGLLPESRMAWDEVGEFFERVLPE